MWCDYYLRKRDHGEEIQKYYRRKLFNILLGWSHFQEQSWWTPCAYSPWRPPAVVWGWEKMPDLKKKDPYGPGCLLGLHSAYVWWLQWSPWFSRGVALPAAQALKVTCIECIKVNLTQYKAKATCADACDSSGCPTNHTDPLPLFLCDNSIKEEALWDKCRKF